MGVGGMGGKQMEPVQKERGSPYYLADERKKVTDINVFQLEGDEGARSPQARWQPGTPGQYYQLQVR